MDLTPEETSGRGMLPLPGGGGCIIWGVAVEVEVAGKGLKVYTAQGQGLYMFAFAWSVGHVLEVPSAAET